MTTSEAVRMLKLVLVCHDCRKGLEVLGARVAEEGATITLGQPCEAHPTKLHLQAQHPMRVAPSALRQWQEAPQDSDVLSEDERGPFVAELASRLLAGNLGATDADVRAAVGTARRILRASKGG